MSAVLFFTLISIFTYFSYEVPEGMLRQDSAQVLRPIDPPRVSAKVIQSPAQEEVIEVVVEVQEKEITEPKEEKKEKEKKEGKDKIE